MKVERWWEDSIVLIDAQARLDGALGLFVSVDLVPVAVPVGFGVATAGEGW